MSIQSISSIIRAIHSISPLCYQTFPQVIEVIEAYGKSNPTDWIEWHNGQPGCHKLFSSESFELELLFLQHKTPRRLRDHTLNAIKVLDGRVELETPRLFSEKLMPSHAVKEYWVRRPTVLTSISNVSSNVSSASVTSASVTSSNVSSNVSTVLIGRLVFSN